MVSAIHAGEGSRALGGDVRNWRLSRTGSGATARLKAVPAAAGLGVEGADFLDFEQCRQPSRVPAMSPKRARSDISLALWPRLVADDAPRL
jgi:hypothetical protein